MKKESQLYLSKAERAIQAAERELKAGDFEFAANRAYYSMFYTAEALLCHKDLKFRKHSAVHAAYGTHFSKTKELDPKFHQWFLASFEQRIISDYEIEPEIVEKAAREQINHAQGFLAGARAYLSDI